jgi:integrase/recombinase XerC
MNVNIVPYSSTGIDRARAWATIPDDERRRRAVEACHTHDTTLLQEITDAWLTLHGQAGATVSPHTRASYRRGVAVLVEAWREQNLLHPQSDAGALWLREMEDTGLKPATVRARLAGARALYAALRWCKATDANPFTDARPAQDKTAAKDKRAPYEQDELTALLAELDETAHTAKPAARTMAHYDRVLVLLGAHAGLRASEMMELRWSDVDLLRRRVVVQHGKGGKRRQVVVSSSLAAALATIPPEMRGVYVLPYRSRGAAWYRLKRLTDQAGINAHGLHRLRHSAGTRMMRETNNLQEVAELLGHAQLDTARVYAAWANDTQRKTVGEW